MRSGPAILMALLPLLGPLAITESQACPLLTGTGELELGAGHDDNLMLSVAPDAPDTLLRRGGYYGSLSPALAGSCAGRGMTLRAAFIGDYRGTREVGRLDSHGFELRGWLPRLGFMRLQLAASAGAFLAKSFREDEYWFVGAELTAINRLADEVSLMLSMRADRRYMLANGGERDWLLAPTVRLATNPSEQLEVAPFFSALDVRPTAMGVDPVDRFSRWRGGLDVTVSLGRLSLNGEGWAGRIRYYETTETHVGGRLQARFDLGGSFDVYAAADLAEPVSAGATGDYARHLFSVGTAARLAYQRRRARDEQPELRPRLERGKVRFRFRSEGALEVTVVGSWDEWAGPGRALEPTRKSGIWELVTALPPGSHRYHFLVDGEPRRPPDALRYVADDFGSEDGVLEIPPSAEPGSPAASGSVQEPRP